MLDVVQGTDAWLLARAGKVTASRVADVVAKTKSGYGASRATYMGQLIAERLTGVPTDTFTNGAMAHGTAMEPFAREAYQAQTFDDVVEVGFIDHPRIEWSGASPDGFVGSDGLVEIKAPNTSTHIETLISQKVPDKYLTQMYWQMSATGRAWCDYVSWDNRLPQHMQLFVKRVGRDDDRIAELEKEVAVFLAELDEKVGKLLALYGEGNVAAA
jgi:putative phage-type endonuclease